MTGQEKEIIRKKIMLCEFQVTRFANVTSGLDSHFRACKMPRRNFSFGGVAVSGLWKPTEEETIVHVETI